MNTEHLSRLAELMLITNPSRGISVDSLVEVLDSLEVTNLTDGSRLCSQGDPGDKLWVLVKGKIRVHRDEADGTSRDIIRMSPPTMVGHMALVDNKPRSAHCTAEGETTLLTMTRQIYQMILEENSLRGTTLRRLLLTSLTRQLQGATRRIKEVRGGEESGESAGYEASKAAIERRSREFNEIAQVLNGWGGDSPSGPD
jgi:CRP-like cAMP-binding protein